MRRGTSAAAVSVDDVVQRLQGAVDSLSSVTFTSEVVDVRPVRDGAFATVADRGTAVQVFVPQHNLSYARGARLEAGQKVRLTANWRVATASQRCTARVSFLRPLPGTGAIAHQREQAVSALSDEGLLRREFEGFGYTPSAELYQQFTFSSVLLLTPSGSDGGTDFKHKAYMMNRRGALSERGVGVQGRDAAAELSSVLRSITPEDADLVCIVRGGGSWADLRTFDDLELARAIATCAVPVMVAVGHHGNVSLADLVAAATFPTPNDAGARLDNAYRNQHSKNGRTERDRAARPGVSDSGSRASSRQAQIASLRRDLRVAAQAQSEQHQQIQALVQQLSQLRRVTGGPLLDAARQRIRRRARMVATALWLAAAAFAVTTLDLRQGWPPQLEVSQVVWFSLVVALAAAGVVMWRRLRRLRRPPSQRAVRLSPPARDAVEWSDRVARTRRLGELWVLTHHRPAW